MDEELESQCAMASEYLKLLVARDDPFTRVFGDHWLELLRSRTPEHMEEKARRRGLHIPSQSRLD